MKRETNEMHQSIGIGVAIVFTIVYLEIDTADFNLRITNSDKTDQPQIFSRAKKDICLIQAQFLLVPKSAFKENGSLHKPV